MRKLLLTTLLLIPAISSANDSGSLTPNDVVRNADIFCPMTFDRSIYEQIGDCLDEMEFYSSQFFIWPNGDVTYTGKHDGDLYRGAIDLRYKGMPV